MTVVAQGQEMQVQEQLFGFSGMQCADILNAVGVLQGKPIATLRMSNADIRHRHYGISHHCLTAISKATFTPVIIPLPLLMTTLNVNKNCLRISQLLVKINLMQL